MTVHTQKGERSEGNPTGHGTGSCWDQAPRSLGYFSNSMSRTHSFLIFPNILLVFLTENNTYVFAKRLSSLRHMHGMLDLLVGVSCPGHTLVLCSKDTSAKCKKEL